MEYLDGESSSFLCIFENHCPLPVISSVKVKIYLPYRIGILTKLTRELLPIGLPYGSLLLPWHGPLTETLRA